MTAVPDSELFTEAERVRGKVVLITGAASGFGRASALLFAQYGAKLVLADRVTQGAEKVGKEIKDLGSQAIVHTCDVTSWEQQLELFQRAIKEYGAVDIVVASAGVIERGRFVPPEVNANNVPIKPSLVTINVNLIGVLYTAHLAQHYLLLDYRPKAFKSLIFVGSMASFEAIPLGTLYTTSKHAIIGLHKTIYDIHSEKIHIATVCPWFSDTGMMVTPLRVFLAGIPLTPVDRVAGAIVKAATETDPDRNGAVYTLPDGGETFRLDRKDFTIGTGVYKLLGDRAEAFLLGYAKIYYYITTVAELLKIGGFKLFVVALLPLVFYGWTRGDIISSTLKNLQNRFHSFGSV